MIRFRALHTVSNMCEPFRPVHQLGYGSFRQRVGADRVHHDSFQLKTTSFGVATHQDNAAPDNFHFRFQNKNYHFTL